MFPMDGWPDWIGRDCRAYGGSADGTEAFLAAIRQP